MNKFIATDAFNMLAGDKIGGGVYRDVFACKIRPELVVKVEIYPENSYRSFHNVQEMQFWDNMQHAPKWAKWLAPCHYLSPEGHILLQERVTPATEADLDKLPLYLPTFLTDRKFGNYGWAKDGRLVCVDYALTISNPSLKMTKADFW